MITALTIGAGVFVAWVLFRLTCRWLFGDWLQHP
jgi:hypothetical protein